MNHTASKIKVYQTEDYKIFQMVEGNRPLNKKKIERIVAEIQAGNDVLDEVPILVKEAKNKLQVMDGQHRLAVAKDLKRPVHYIIHTDVMTLHNVAKINSNTEKWKNVDFINAYVIAGNDHYKKLQKFHNEYGIAIGLSLVLLANGTLRSDGGTDFDKLRSSFETGEFEVKKYKDAVMIADICKQFEAFAAWNSRPFVLAMCRLLEAGKPDFKMDTLLTKFRKDPSRLQFHSSWKAYMTNLEEIYNIGNGIRRVIY